MRHEVYVEGERFSFPDRCSCCLARTTRFERHTGSGHALDLPTCAPCSKVSALAALVRALGWASFVAWVLVANRTTDGETGAYLIVLFGGFAVTLAIAYVVTSWVPPFHRRGHTSRCRPVTLFPGAIRCANRHFASLVRGGPHGDRAQSLARAADIIERG